MARRPHTALREFVAPVASLAAAAIMAASASAISAPTTRHVTVVGGTKGQRELARLTAKRVGGITLNRVVFRSPSRALTHQHVTGTEMFVSSAGRETIRSDFEQSLYLGTYLGLMRRWPQGAIAAASAAHEEAPVARLQPLDVFGSNPSGRSVGRFHLALIAAVDRARATLVELRTSALPARVVLLNVRVDDPAAFLKHRARSILAIFDKPTIPLVGFYFGLQDAHGRLIWATYRLPSVGAVYVIPRLDSCSPVPHSEPALHQPPPCPAR